MLQRRAKFSRCMWVEFGKSVLYYVVL